ncbi:hypothetical protein MZM54_03590 [[Brevibacterium] frigoritolerans]|nr:hypothetical protein [Peribacillus frigoritolerans]
MKEDEVSIHRNSKDIVQKLLLFGFPVGSDPLAILGESVGKITSVEPTDILAVRTVDDAADVLFRLENDVILHIEVQTNYRTKDIFRFAEYDAYLLNERYLDEDVIIKTVVIFTHRVDPEKVQASFDKGSIRYEYTPICLKNEDADDYLKGIMEKIENNPDYKLTTEDRLLLLYIPLMKSELSLSESVISITKTVQKLNDKRQVFNAVGTMLAFHNKNLNDDIANKLWEVLKMGGAVFEEFQKEVVEKAKQEGKKEQMIETAEQMVRLKFKDEDILKAINISQKELKEIKRKLNQ